MMAYRYWPNCFVVVVIVVVVVVFFDFMGRDEVEVYKNAKRKNG